MQRTMFVLLPSLVLALPAYGQQPAAPPQPQWSDRGAFVIMLGQDTVAVEHFRRGSGRIEGEVVSRAPRTSLRRYMVEMTREGGVSRVEVVQRRPGAPADTPPIQTTVVTFANDTATIEIRRDTTVQRRQVAVTRGAVPLFAGSYVPYELIARAARGGRSPRDSVAVPIYPIGGATSLVTWVRRERGDSVVFTNDFGTYRARMDRSGRLMGWVPTRGTQQVSVNRLERLDVDAQAAAWVARDQQGQGTGQLSPRDTVRAGVGGASLIIDYGRPSKRGRVIFGNVVPWNEVWRTGANAATQLRTDRDLVMGGVTIPAGIYTLWTLPSPTGWKLIVNQQTGQWGTDYHADRDLVRIDLAVSTLASAVERFTITIETSGQGGSLVMEWDTTRASLPFTVR